LTQVKNQLSKTFIPMLHITPSARNGAFNQCLSW
jgi:hypothetical protein